jgi:hypothetical protein
VIFGPQKLHKNFMKCPSEEFFEELKIRNALSQNSAKNVFSISDTPIRGRKLYQILLANFIFFSPSRK